MKKEWEDFKASLSDIVMMSKKEFLLIVAVAALGGVVFGMLFSPRKFMMIGSNNGNCKNGNTGKKAQDAKKADEIADWSEVEEKEAGTR